MVEDIGGPLVSHMLCLPPHVSSSHTHNVNTYIKINKQTRLQKQRGAPCFLLHPQSTLKGPKSRVSKLLHHRLFLLVLSSGREGR